MEARSGEIRQRSASLELIISNKKVRGAAGTDYFILITTACPQNGTFDAVVIAVDLEHLEDRDESY
ncbi:hypothetical protein [Ignatzschineria cameli]|uniref:hypothetical protein n=1 Tax=Ignatzschineria cameli TaxID=2182793 RepID=UPI0010576ACE|nr:hypothetical protein [Ignatzschineria cameli]